jgi:hypothetical protein
LFRLRSNGYFTGFDKVRVWLATRLFRFLLTPDEIRDALRDDTNLSATTREQARRLLRDKPLKVIVMGHTHELDATKHYVNLGTWIDHVPGLAHSDLVKVDRSFPVLIVYDDDSAALHDCRQLSGAVTDAHLLWEHDKD